MVSLVLFISVSQWPHRPDYYALGHAILDSGSMARHLVSRLGLMRSREESKFDNRELRACSVEE